MKLPSLNAIRVFETAARLRSFKDAADELNLTPSAISRHIRTLEETLGIELFERGFRQVTLTTRGMHYARRLSEAFRTIEDATDAASIQGFIRSNKPKRVTLSINATFMNLWLADRLPRFRSVYPDYELDVSTHDDRGKGGNDNADLRILLAFADPGDPSLELLVPLVIMPVCSPALLEGPEPLRTPADLARHRLLHENTTAWWEEWITWEKLEGVDAKRGALFQDPSLAIREAVNGGGVALADNIMAEDLLARGLLVEPFEVRHPIPENYRLQQKQATRHRSGIRQFREWLLLEVARHKDSMRIA